jgi:hypothetical protein
MHLLRQLEILRHFPAQRTEHFPEGLFVKRENAYKFFAGNCLN